MAKRHYTAAEDARIRELHGQRVTIKDIAAELGRTSVAISARLNSLGIRRTNFRWLPEHDEQLKTLWLGHVEVPDIAATMNRTAAAVKQRAHQLGLHRDNRKTKLAQRYGVDVLASGKDVLLIMAEMREAEETRKREEAERHQAKINTVLDAMATGINAGCDRAFMFTAALVAGATLQQIGDRVGITRERVRQVIEARTNATN